MDHKMKILVHIIIVFWSVIFMTNHANSAPCNNRSLRAFKGCFEHMNYGPRVWQMTAESCANSVEKSQDQLDARKTFQNNAFLVRWFNQNMWKKTNRDNPADKMNCDRFMKFAEQGYPDDPKLSAFVARYNNAIEARKHIPGEREPNEGDVIRALAPYLAGGLRLSGKECDLTRLSGCQINMGMARFSLSIAYARDISCKHDDGLLCSFTLKMNCSSNDPSGVFCKTYRAPYQYENVLFVKSTKGWTALPSKKN